MRVRLLLSLVIILSCISFGQKRVLFSPWNDAIPVAKGKSVPKAIQDFMKQKKAREASLTCNPVRQSTDFNPADYNHTIDNSIQRRDIVADWFQTQTAGTLDSIFFFIGSASGSGGADSAMNLRIFTSNIYPGHRPGQGGFLPPERLFWGYFNDSNDPEDGVAAFPEDATQYDTIHTQNGDSIVAQWFSTYRYNNYNIVFDSLSPSNGGAPWKPLGHGDPRDTASGKCTSTSVVCYWDTTLQTYQPTGTEIWGGGVGVPIKISTEGISSADLSVLGSPSLHIGDAFFVTLKVLPDPSNPSSLVATNFAASQDGLPQNPEGNYESHNWKFYELRPHAAPYSTDTSKTEHGWFARGDFNLMIWYTLTATSNTPPDFPEVDELHSTFNTGVRPVNAVITDCNFADSTHAGVNDAEIVYFTNSQPVEQTVPMTSLDQTNYSGNIPG
ncbi:MAG TPA: hypothetical protein VKS81_01395, partial [Bacteroidota bacterium]|nr:hypothetical protein [Bacteroidota bacterium]